MANLVTNEYPDTGLASLPDIDVEISLAPPTQGPIWRSITSDVRMASGLAIRRGRSRELDRFQTGTLDLELSNRDREFDPEHASSPIADHVKPMRRVRVLARHSVSTLPITDTYAHYDATDSSTITLNGSNVSQWADKSGNARHLTQSTATNQPLYTGARTMNGRATVEFDGVDNYLASANLTQAQPFTVFAAFQSDIYVGGSDGATVVALGANGPDFFLRGTGVWTVWASTTLELGVTGDSHPHIFAGVFNGASSEFRLDGSLAAASTPGTGGLSGEAITVGNYPGSATGWWNGLIGEILIYSRALSASEILSVENYLLSKWTRPRQYVWFDGYIDGFEQKYPDLDSDAVAEISAGDGFKVLAQCDLPDDSPFDLEVLADRPIVWHKLGDVTAGGTISDASGNGYTGSYGATSATFSPSSVSGLVAQSGDGAADFDGTNDFAVVATSLDTTNTWTTSSFSIEFWFQTTQTPAAGKTAVVFDPGGISGLRAIHLDEFGVLTNSISGTNSAVNDGAIHHVVLTSAGAFNTFYLDGVLQSGSGTISLVGTPVRAMCIGFMPGYLPSGHVFFDGVIDEVALYDYELSATRVLAHYNAGKAGSTGAWGGDATGTRARRVLDHANWPGDGLSASHDRDLDTGNSTCGPTGGFGGTAALDYLQTLADTEQGQFYMGLDGAMSSDDHFKACLRQRHALITSSRSTTSQATFGDSAGELPYADILIDYNEQRIYNAAEVTRSGGTTQRANDRESEREYLKRTYTKSSLLYASDSDSDDHAHWAVDRYSDPEFRIIGLVLKPQRDEEIKPHALGREIGDRITVKRRPQGVGSAISKEVIIEGVEHTIQDGEWTTVWRLSEAEARAYWIMGTSVLGTTTRLGF